MSERKVIWQKISGEWKIKATAKISKVCTLETLEPEIQRILDGQQTGRVLVQHSGIPDE
jgi:hypothetical protein